MNLGVVFEHFDGHGFGAMGKTNICTTMQMDCKWCKSSHNWVHCNHLSTTLLHNDSKIIYEN